MNFSTKNIYCVVMFDDDSGCNDDGCLSSIVEIQISNFSEKGKNPKKKNQ